VFFGTTGGTYGTADEFEIRDHTPDGNLRLSRKHAIIIGGLEAGAAYGILVEGTNGVTTSFERDLFAGKVAGVHQPPGGGGQFTTSNDPDTQLPVILSGPTVTSKTHDSAIIEYTTDEPADTGTQFGTEEAPLSETETSGVMETKHKLTLTNLEAGTSYLYLVESTDASGNGATQSSMAVFTTDPEIDVTAPGFDVEPNISYKNDETATVSWTMDEESTGEVRFGTSAEELGFIRTLPETGTLHEITLTNLEVATEYFFQTSSSDLSNNGPSESTVFSFTTDAAADLAAPIITDLQFEPNNESAVITWTTDEFADSFIDFGTTSGLLDLAVGSVDDVLEHEVVLTNLTASTTYFFTAGSIDRANNPATATAEQSFTTLGSADATPPAVPANLSGSSGNGLAILTWDANSELDFDSYTLARRLEGVGDFADIASGLTGLTYTDQGLTNDVAYEYQINAVDKTGNPSDGSTALAVTPTGTMAPTLPIDLARGGESLTPTFSFTNATPFVSQAALTYTIQVSSQEDFSNVVDSESGILSGDTETSWTITRDLTADVTYYWRVRAIEGELIGQWTDTQQFLAQDVTLVGDFNDDLTVNLDDFFLFADKFGQAATGEAAKFDLAPDGTIDLDDFFLFADKFGTSAAAKQWAFAQYLDEEAHVWIEASTDNTGDRLGQGLVTVRVKAEQVNDIAAFGLVLNYDHTAVTFEAAEEGPGHLLEMNGANAPFFTVFRHRPGQLVIGNALVDDEPVSGQGLLAQLTFQTRQGPTNDAFFELADVVVANNGSTRRIARTSAVRLKPDTYRLSANFPNPFNPTTTIDYALPEAAHVQLVIYDLLGQAIRTMTNSHHEPGFYSAVWNATDDDNRPVANGLYFYKLSAGHFNSIGKMMLLK
jgi:chitodextrinase